VKRLQALVVGAALVSGACGIGGGEVRAGPLPTCDTTSRGLLFLMAQAVPTAEFVPCLESLPEGWELERARVETGRAVLTLDNPGIGDVTITLVESCSHTGRLIDYGGPPGVQVYEEATAALTVQAIVYAGGCVTIERPTRLTAAEITTEISYLSRDELRATSDLDL